MSLTSTILKTKLQQVVVWQNARKQAFSEMYFLPPVLVNVTLEYLGSWSSFESSVSVFLSVMASIQITASSCTPMHFKFRVGAASYLREVHDFIDQQPLEHLVYFIVAYVFSGTQGTWCSPGM
jgi:hypothetical protein